MRPIIKVEKLSKRYRIGRRREPYRTVRESLTTALAAPVRGIGALLNGNSRVNGHNADEWVWALRDVSFEVMPGEVLGIIGRNGAGKSTLLKLMSRITEPTDGRIELYGRVGSLLEVGTGFHPELTGRENTFLMGAILGMRHAEITHKFDDIVAFAEVEKFIDTPVKHYSSGMYMRLAFAVAAHLEPEILLVDEVLAVGDAAFQKKCLGKMGDVAKQGRTVLFVSHNMTAIQSLCDSCLLIKNGGLEARGVPGEIVTDYLAGQLARDLGHCSLNVHPGRRSGSVPTMTAVNLHSEASEAEGAIRMGARVSLRVAYSASRPIRPVLGVTVKTSDGAPVFHVSDRYCGQLADCEPRACGTVTCTIESLPLLPGTYLADLWFGDAADFTRDLDVILDAVSFEVLPVDLYGTGRLQSSSLGPVFSKATWTLRDHPVSDGANAALPGAREIDGERQQ
jgi:lipopolysaccharide transport system ATP-binding protein